MTEETTSPLCTKPHCSVKPSLFPSSVNTPFSTKLFKEHSTRVQIYMSTDGNKETKYYPVQATQKCHRSVATTQIFLFAFGYKNVKQMNNPSSVRIMLFSVPPQQLPRLGLKPLRGHKHASFIAFRTSKILDCQVCHTKPTKSTDKNHCHQKIHRSLIVESLWKINAFVTRPELPQGWSRSCSV